MIALQIADIRYFMKKLLLGSAFDHFLLLEGSITTFNTFHIDGKLQKSYFTIEEQEQMENCQYSRWAQIRPFCLELIKGKKTPLSFHFTFRLSESNTEKFLIQSKSPFPSEQVQGLLIHVRYDGHDLTCTTGVSLSVFTMNKQTDHAWDDMVLKYFRQQEIPFTIS